MDQGPTSTRLTQLKRRHQELDSQVEQLERRRFLTPHERREVQKLKKLKLQMKDDITRLERLAG